MAYHLKGGALLAALGALVCAPTALGDRSVITNLDAAGRDDPVALVPRTFTVVANTSVKKRVLIKYRAVGGAPCAPSANSDSGTWALQWPYYFEINGDKTTGEVKTWSTTGPLMFCTWLADNGSSVATPITQTITFRSPTSTIDASQSPSPATAGADFIIGASLTTEAPARFYATLANPGVACAGTFGSDSGSELTDGTEVNGTASFQWKVNRPAGTYMLCTWLAKSASDTAPIARQSFPISVVAPPAPPPPPPPPAKAATAVGVAFPSSIRLRRLVAIRARVSATSGTPTGMCYADRFISRRWEPIASGAVASNGICRMTVRMGRRGREQLRVRYRPSGNFLASVSRYRSVRVR